MTQEFEEKNKIMVKENQDLNIKMQAREKEILILKQKVKKFETKYRNTLQESKNQISSMIQSNVNKSKVNNPV